jgi:UDP-N-acetylmuramoyl-tripeptide--D-alanyl-D-alanine ligase
MGEVADLLESVCGVPEAVVQGYSIDSRTLVPGELFFALRGPRFDGHEFVPAAFSRGAVGAVVHASFAAACAPSLRPALIPVSDTVRALQQLARAVRRKWGKQVVAVTGSTGKTTTKEMIAAMLGERLAVHKSPGNLNNYYGLPLALLALEPQHDVAVLELAMSAPGEIALLARIAAPSIGVVTNVAPVHLQFFESVEAIARAKYELLENLEAPATAILNHDDARVRRFAEGFEGRVITFGFGKGADFQARDVNISSNCGSEFRVSGLESDNPFYLPLPGRFNVANALAAIATASLFDVPTGDLRRALAAFQNVRQRSEILTLPGEVTVINDCYNSNPLAMEQALEMLGAWSGAGRKIVVAGEMLELGPNSPQFHRAVGRRCAEVGLDWLLAVQGDARFFLEGALERGLPADRAHFFGKAVEAGEFCRALLEPGDVVLVKGSRAVHLEGVITLLSCPSRPRGQPTAVSKNVSAV